MVPSDEETSDYRYSPLVARNSSNHDNENPSDDDDGSRLERLEAREQELAVQLEAWEMKWKERSTPVMEELESVRIQKQMLVYDMAIKHRFSVEPSDASWLAFVDSDMFYLLSFAVLIANIIVVLCEETGGGHERTYIILEGIFVSWYILELLLRLCLHGHRCFCGKLSFVFWNWLDLVVLICSIIYFYMVQNRDLIGVRHLRTLRALRALRLLRFLRLLNIVKLILVSDLSWAEGRVFQTFIVIVIVINAAIMGLELDLPWDGWYWCEQLILAIYCFELAVKLKHAGLWAFHSSMWNVLDLVIVLGGLLDQCIVPAYIFIEHLFIIDVSSESSTFGFVMIILRTMRLLRVMRLLRLLRSVKPLHRLLVGVVEAMHGMQWVLLLTFILLYASAIVFTILVGKGLIFEEIPEGAEENFGSVMQSLFMLFKLMNDDQSVADSIITTVPGKIIFMGFMVVSNWAILAILTSVVSDNMISASQRGEREEKQKYVVVARELSAKQMLDIFKRMDIDGSGELDEQEFKAMLNDAQLCDELREASGLRQEDLAELFDLISEPNQDGQRTLAYEDFIKKMLDEGTAAKERSVLRCTMQMREMERRLEQRIDTILDALSISGDVRANLPTMTMRRSVLKRHSRRQRSSRSTYTHISL